ncbi:hypothetical protein NDJ83_17915 [Vibrio alginolyticus]|uniref:hypothetical protein n=1 Tax=Vibrio alginolyticus TaxID=663 RepID=UPI00215DEEF9|nr:hypothetical protein [Vibrio alginolyticus]MCS0281102.1 hypothetical protein [Vibrio alginolyticus]
MSKIDYVAHQAAYIKALEENAKLTVKQYCEDKGLKYATARRHLRKPDKEVIKKLKNDTKKKKAKSEVARVNRTPAQAKWAEHVRNFLSRGIKNPSLKVPEFARSQGLASSSLRREIAKLRKAPDFEQLFDLYDEKVELFRAMQNGSGKKNTDKSKGGARRGKSPKASEREQSDGSRGGVDPENAQNGSPSLDDVGLGKGAELITRFTNFSASRFESAQHKKHQLNELMDGRRGARHGGYCSDINLISEMLDVLEKADPLSVSEELLVARARYRKMHLWLSKELDTVQLHIDEDIPMLDADGEKVDPKRVQKELLFAYEPRLSELERGIANLVALENKRHFDHRKQLIEEMKMPHYLPAEETALVVQVLELRERNGWDALTTAKNLERLGAKVPPALLLELKDELETAEPEILEGEVSPEEFERRQIQYFKGLEEREQEKWDTKKVELDALFDEFSPDTAGDYDALPIADSEDDE